MLWTIDLAGGREMILGWYTEKVDGKMREGHGIISAEDFLTGKETYRFLCPVNNGR